MESITLTETVPLTCGIYRICLVPRYLASSPSISLASLLFTKLQAPQRLILKLNTFVFAFRTLHWFFLLKHLLPPSTLDFHMAMFFPSIYSQLKCYQLKVFPWLL